MFFKFKLHIVQSSKKYVLPLKLKIFEIQRKSNQLTWTTVEKVTSNTISKGQCWKSYVYGQC